MGGFSSPVMNAYTLKSLGAYYTDRLVAEFLVTWAVREPDDKVLDPSCGNGVFLTAAARRLQSLGCRYPPQVFGIDIHEEAISGISGTSFPSNHLVVSDFFEVSVDEIGLVDAVVGNPPFIRYQRFGGKSRARALEVSRQSGVNLPELSSSWAPFVVHATRFLKPGGRLAMIVPAEINHAAYAHPVVQYLLEHFHYIRLIAFRERLFPELNQDTLCLLASGYGQECRDFSLVIAESARSLGEIDLDNGVQMDARAIHEGKQRIFQYLLPEKSRKLYNDLTQHKSVQVLGDLGSVGIGYVTGSNDFFHLSRSEVRFYGIPESLLRPAVRSGRHLRGLRFTTADWKSLEAAGNKVWLLFIPPDHRELPPQVKEYLEEGKRRRVHIAYKCRVRKPWYSVPHVYVGDLFLTYMSGISPRLVVNEAKVVAPNSLHIVRLHKSASMPPDLLAVLWHTSLTMLSCEIEGHALGGGMLKLEPAEARKVSIPAPDVGFARQEISRLDSMLREGRFYDALDHADRLILIQGLGLTGQDCDTLREGYEVLREWRMR